MPSTLQHHFKTMAVNNAWCNLRLLRACALLSDEDFRASRTSFFPSLVATLNHNLTVDWYYVDALERAVYGQPPNTEARRFFEPEQPYDRCAPLLEAQREVDRRLVALCVALREEDLERPVPIQRRDGLKSETASRMLAHLFQHQIHHRGQIHAMLAGSAVAPPQLDEFFCAGEAHLRAAELEELGYTEEWVWGQ